MLSHTLLQKNDSEGLCKYFFDVQELDFYYAVSIGQRSLSTNLNCLFILKQFIVILFVIPI